MSKLQQLLDDNKTLDAIILAIPREGSGAFTWSEMKEVAKEAFTQGYNAAKEEAKGVVQEMIDGPFNGSQHKDPLLASGYRMALEDVRATLYTV
jgi:hypothetical protein